MTVPIFENSAIVYDGKLFAVENHVISKQDCEGKLVVECRLSGLCGTDVRMIRGERECKTSILGHESTAVVVKNPMGYGGFNEGERVFVNPNAGPKTLNRGHLGHDRPGLFQKYILFDEVDCESHLSHRIPSQISDTEALFLEPLSCAAHTMNKLVLEDLRSKRLLIFGAGSLALAHVHVLKLLGVKQEHIYIANRTTERAKFLAKNTDIPEKNVLEIDDLIGISALGVDICLLLNSNSDVYLKHAFEAIGDGGLIVVFGGIAQPVGVALDGEQTVDLLDIRLNEKIVEGMLRKKRFTLQGTRGFTASDTALVLELQCRGEKQALNFVGEEMNISDFTHLLNQLSDPAKTVPFGKQICQF